MQAPSVRAESCLGDEGTGTGTGDDTGNGTGSRLMQQIDAGLGCTIIHHRRAGVLSVNRPRGSASQVADHRAHALVTAVLNR